jgi:hypothetical protein
MRKRYDLMWEEKANKRTLVSSLIIRYKISVRVADSYVDDDDDDVIICSSIGESSNLSM